MALQSRTITENHSNQDPRYSQKPIYYAILANQIWSWILCSPVIQQMSSMYTKRPLRGPKCENARDIIRANKKGAFAIPKGRRLKIHFPLCVTSCLILFICFYADLMVLSYGEVYRKGTQGSLLAWRAASLLLGRLLLLLVECKPAEFFQSEQWSSEDFR